MFVVVLCSDWRKAIKFNEKVVISRDRSKAMNFYQRLKGSVCAEDNSADPVDDNYKFASYKPEGSATNLANTLACIPKNRLKCSEL